MARPKKTDPKYRYHVSGQAVVTLDGKDFYLGKHDSPESRARYHNLLAEYNANGLVAPEQVTHQADLPITVGDVTAEFREAAALKYANSKEEERWYGALCKRLEKYHRDLPAEEFGPRKLNEIRNKFIEDGNKRTTVNRKIAGIRKIFKHAVSMELIPNDVWTRLTALEPLQYGQTTAGESEPVRPVDLDDVRATAKFLSPILKAMIDLHVSCGMRPSEVFRMRPCDIEKRRDGVWLYRPYKHKNQRRKKERIIPIVGDTRITLGPYLDRDPESFCFVPRESVEWVNARRREARITKVQPSQVNRTKPNGQRRPGEQWTRTTYRNAIQGAAKKANVRHWFPLQLRHTSATEVRRALGIEHAQHLLGHSHVSTTEIYAERNLDKAIEAAKVTPRLGNHR